jgi:HrpA-like RNA helicase
MADDDDAGMVVSRKKHRAENSKDEGIRMKKKQKKEVALRDPEGDKALPREDQARLTQGKPDGVSGWKSHKKAESTEKHAAPHASAAQSPACAPSERSPSKEKAGAEGTSAGAGKMNERDTIQRHRQELPMYQARKEILWTLKRFDTLVLVGETGSGKTTQV